MSSHISIGRIASSVRFSIYCAALALVSLSFADAAEWTANADIGKEVYAKCLGCHSFHVNRTGPLHCGLFGRKVGSVKGYTYSDAMQNADFIWDEATLDDFLSSPLSMLAGTSMGFAGINDSQQRRDLIAFLKRQSASELCNTTLQSE